MSKELSKRATIVLNYLKKHNAKIVMKWNCGIQIYKVLKDYKEVNYPRINEDIWCEVSDLFYEEGDYQIKMLYSLKEEKK